MAHVRHALRGRYVRAYPRESQEMIFDAHVRAFALFAGVPTRGIYDNMKTAVDAAMDPDPPSQAETAHRDAASIRYHMRAAKLPVLKDLDAFVFEGMPINEGLVRSLHAGAVLPNRRNIVLVGGTGIGKTHLATAIAAAVIRADARGRDFNTVELVNRLE